jgi:molybdopterin-guanine dinucleotide biosynthesis protein A
VRSDVGAAIIAGGLSRRLGGGAKSFLPIAGRTVADRQLAVLRAAFARVWVVANDPAPWAGLAVEVVPDRVAGAGPLAGIAAALAAAGDCQAVVCVAGDLPFLSPALLTALRDRVPAAGALAPRRGERAEPLCARYATRLLPAVEARLARGDFAVHALLDSVGADWIDDRALAALDPAGLSFFNLNTPEDLQRAEEMARQPS